MSKQPLKCPECGHDMQLRNSRFGKFYGCTQYPNCNATHGAHRNGKPLGIPANKETKQWRITAHDAFDTLWKPRRSAPMSRGEAYRWLQDSMKLSPDDCHIGRFTIDQCKKVVELINGRSKK